MLLSEVQRQRAAQYVRGYLLRTAVNYGHKNAERRATQRWMHTLNVVKNVLTICEGERATAETRAICEMAAMFHDIDHYTVDLPYHGARGAETAAAYLKKEGYPIPFAERVAAAVRAHHYDLDDDQPITEQMAEIAGLLSHEAQMVMDAETLDKIGATNILQSILTLSGINNPMQHEVGAEMISGWPLQRALSWQMTLITPTGKAIGAQRMKFYEGFLRQVADEMVLRDPFPKPSMQTQEMLLVP
jgi:predicted metal-dependent HD superfamily phosphohydrolase